MSDTKLSLNEVLALAQSALEGAGATAANAAAVARSTQLAERDGIRSHGLMYVPIYAEHVQCGKVNGESKPVVTQPRASAICVDAQSGFAHPAIDAGWDSLLEAAKQNGVAAMTLFNSYNCGVLGHHAERFAEAGFLGLCFTHAPASIAPIGGNKPVVGTNPFAVGVPGKQGSAAMVIDQSASAIAKSEIMLRARTGEAIEPGWAFDADGNPTTDAQAALKGSMAPAGGYKGFGVGLLVEILAAALSGAVPSTDASPFSGTAGGPPNTGQCFIAIDPNAFAGDQFHANIAQLCTAITDQSGARLPGSRREARRADTAANGVLVDDALMQRINAFI